MSILEDAKEVAKAVQEINNLDLYKRVLNLHSDIIGLVEENNRLRDENRELVKTIDLKKKMHFRSPYYWQEDDPVPFCPKCWEGKTLPAHVMGVESGKKYVQCGEYFAA
jgi:hypothetical protein